MSTFLLSYFLHFSAGRCLQPANCRGRDARVPTGKQPADNRGREEAVDASALRGPRLRRAHDVHGDDGDGGAPPPLRQCHMANASPSKETNASSSTRWQRRYVKSEKSESCKDFADYWVKQSVPRTPRTLLKTDNMGKTFFPESFCILRFSALFY